MDKTNILLKGGAFMLGFSDHVDWRFDTTG